MSLYCVCVGCHEGGETLLDWVGLLDVGGPTSLGRVGLCRFASSGSVVAGRPILCCSASGRPARDFALQPTRDCALQPQRYVLNALDRSGLSSASDRPWGAAAFVRGLCRRAGKDGFVCVWDVRLNRGVEPLGLWFGSCDPHGVGGADAADRGRRRRPTFSLAVYDEAAEADLLERPFPLMNLPAETDRLPYVTWAAGMRPPEGAVPPRVTAISDVVPVQTQKQVAAWMRRFRRCIAAARRGNMLLAGRLRPPDLWLPAEEHMVDGTQHWVFDLTPLRYGGVARVVTPAVSSGSLCVDAVRLLGIGHADGAIVDEMLRGFSDDACLPLGTLLCAPHLGALRYISVAEAKIATSVQRGWAVEWEAIPFWPIRCCPYSIVDESEKAGKPKFRLTNDLSWPKPGMIAGVQSTNDAMDRAAWPRFRQVRVYELAEAAAILASSGLRVRLWALDEEAYYRKVARRPDEVWRQAVVTPDGRWQVDLRTQFGDAAVAVKACRMTSFIAEGVRGRLSVVDAQFPPVEQPVLRWLRARAAAWRRACADGEDATRASWVALYMFGQYVDDGCGGSVDDVVYRPDGAVLNGPDGGEMRRATLHFLVARETVELFGHLSSPAKEVWPCVCLEVLGVEIDLLGGRMRLGKPKRARYAARCRAVAGATFCARDDLHRLVGRLTFAAAVYPRGRQMLHASWRLLGARFRLEGDRVAVTPSVRRDLRWWASVLEREDHDGVPLASRGVFPPVGETGVTAVYADASGLEGWSAWTLVDGVVYMASGSWVAGELELVVADKELFASSVGLVTLSPLGSASYVWEFTDNMVCLGVMRSNVAASPVAQRMLAARVAWCHERGVFTAAERISSRSNEWADIGSRALSRGGVAEVRRRAFELGLQFQLVSVPASWPSLLEFAAGSA